MANAYQTLQTTNPAPHTLQVTLNRPEVANAMNTQMGLDLLDLFHAIAGAPNEQRCIVLTGAGPRAFCAGGDLKERNGMTDQQWQDQHLIFERAIRGIIACPVPIVAAVNGAAYAGGMEIALCCDFIYAAEHARFALTEVTLGIMPGAGGTQTLPRAVGARRAKEILLTGKPFTAQQASDWGMVNRICAADTLLAEALDTAATIAGNAPISTADQEVGELRTEHGPASGMMFEIEAAWCRPRTAAKASARSTKNAGRTSLDADAAALGCPPFHCHCEERGDCATPTVAPASRRRGRGRRWIWSSAMPGWRTRRMRRRWISAWRADVLSRSRRHCKRKGRYSTRAAA
jgi:enoyl-CoA hydratase/carnithine racemase